MNALQTAIVQLDPEQRCLASLDKKENPLAVFLGVPPRLVRGGTVLERLPEDVRHFYIYLGDDEKTAKILQALANSHYSAQIETLDIGSCSEGPFFRVDLRQSIQVLSEINLPALKDLGLGAFELFVNTNPIYDANLGEVDGVIRRAPQLESLRLYGNWNLRESLQLEKLRCFEGWALEESYEEKHIVPATIEKVLSSDFPNLEDLTLCLETDNGFDSEELGRAALSYRFPESFLQGQQWPRLKYMEISGPFTPEAQARLLASPIAKRDGVRYFLFHD